MFEMRGIEKRFDAVVALKGASLDVSPGEIRALLGSNGSGKSTMIKILSGVYYPNAGQILIDGKPVEIQSGQDARNLGIATAYQDLSLIPTMTVMDNILLGDEPVTRNGMIDRNKAIKQVQDLLDRFHINCRLDAYVQTLMPSTQTMLEVAKAVYLKPRLLLLDEVTAALHYDEIEILFNIMRELKKENVAMIYVTHRMDEIFKICDSVTIMRGGETITEGPIDKFNLNDIVYYMTGQHPDLNKNSANHEEFEISGRDLVLNVSHMEMLPKVKDVSLKAYKGEIIGIGGLQGQGQPEFIRAILGAEPIEAGTIEYCGKQIKFRSPDEAVKMGIGFVSGERNREAMFPLRTVEENLASGYVAEGDLFSLLSPKTLKEFSENAVKKFNIKAGSIFHPASSLSGGNQQKLVVARWIAVNPTLLLMDDPTKGVDIISRQEIHQILRDCSAQGMTVVISSSETEELLSIADRIYIFYEGQISGMLEGEDKTAEKLVSSMMGMTLKEYQTEKESA